MKDHVGVVVVVVAVAIVAVIAGAAFKRIRTSKAQAARHVES